VLRSFDRNGPSRRLLINNRSSPTPRFPARFRPWGWASSLANRRRFVIGTREVALIDGSKFRTPRIGVHTIKGVTWRKKA